MTLPTWSASAVTPNGRRLVAWIPGTDISVEARAPTQLARLFLARLNTQDFLARDALVRQGWPPAPEPQAEPTVSISDIDASVAGPWNTEVEE